MQALGKVGKVSNILSICVYGVNMEVFTKKSHISMSCVLSSFLPSFSVSMLLSQVYLWTEWQIPLEVKGPIIAHSFYLCTVVKNAGSGVELSSKSQLMFH